MEELSEINMLYSNNFLFESICLHLIFHKSIFETLITALLTYKNVYLNLSAKFEKRGLFYNLSLPILYKGDNLQMFSIEIFCTV